MLSFEKKLRFFFVKNLNARCSSKVITFEVESKYADKLASQHGLNYHVYKESSSLIEHFNLDTRKHLTAQNYNELLGARFKLRRSKLTYFRDASRRPVVMHGPVFFCMKLYVIEQVA